MFSKVYKEKLWISKLLIPLYTIRGGTIFLVLRAAPTLAGRQVSVPNWSGVMLPGPTWRLWCGSKHPRPGKPASPRAKTPAEDLQCSFCNKLGLSDSVKLPFCRLFIDCLAFVVLLKGHSSFLGYFSSLFHTWHWDNNIAFDYGLGCSPAHTLEYIIRLSEPRRAQFTKRLVNGSTHLWGLQKILESKVPSVVPATHCSPPQHHPGHLPPLLMFHPGEGVRN